MADPTMQDTGANPADASSEAESGSAGYTIEITVTADGKISVGVESSDQENAEESGAPADASDSAQPAKDIKSALVMALEIYKNNGEAPGADDSDEQFASGYGGGQ